ncbi:hypothetical protein K450DRAFT_249615 [Umbelopsis ramanniana AG]|uniref:Uncharacterized protein n=1 Tax=Umbelopsis ramanniana AG TaxID=1314678 RepID=A0AAD5HBD4_UMBRA|nr:uncharacterized protein K450DRAFT_249615 [Umbelopsis ramanniana AG]KAI8577862.1 hypothetical protein K450DRAFT_249615 [Umbelopsis ramanniana AG]
MVGSLPLALLAFAFLKCYNRFPLVQTDPSEVLPNSLIQRWVPSLMARQAAQYMAQILQETGASAGLKTTNRGSTELSIP